MSKKKRPDISAETLLRPRLDRLWADDALLHKDDAAVMGDMDVLARDIAPELFLKTALYAHQAASEAAQARLDAVLPGWLAQRGHVDTLQALAAEQALGPELRPPALAWLEAAGRDTTGLARQPSLFFEAHYLDDETSWDDKKQAYVGVLWYTSPSKEHAQGMGFLIDYHPPWEGSVKDAMVIPQRSPQGLLRHVKSFWREGEAELQNISAERAKTIILTALNCNREAEIRLHRDLIQARDLFERWVLPLPDGPETPDFTMQDFDHLAEHGQRPEEIMHFEQTVGRRVRMKDGQELLIMKDPEGMDDEW